MKKIGIMIPSIDNYFFSSLAQEVTKYLSKKGISVIVLNSSNDNDIDRDNIKTLYEMNVDGILCASDLNTFESIDIPMVCVDRKPESSIPVPWVGNDDSSAIYDATKLLLEKGCRNILISPGYSTEYLKNVRVAGYMKALEEYGITVNPDYILTRKGNRPSHIETEEIVEDVLSKGYPVDAIITSSDRAAFGAMMALRSVGIYAPEEMKLISFDNSPYSAMADTGITAIERNTKEIAKKASDLLLDVMDGKEVKMETIVPVNLILRDSTR